MLPTEVKVRELRTPEEAIAFLKDLVSKMPETEKDAYLSVVLMGYLETEMRGKGGPLYRAVSQVVSKIGLVAVSSTDLETALGDGEPN